MNAWLTGTDLSLSLTTMSMNQDPRVEDNEHEIDEDAAEKDRMEATEDDVIDENHRERRLAVNAQPGDVEVAIEVLGDIVIANAEHEGQR